MIQLIHSFSVILHRVFDSAPVENAACFYMGQQPLHPYEKAGGIYTFCSREDKGTVEITVQCFGYLDEQVRLERHKLNHIFLYPRDGYQPPAGYQAAYDMVKPGEYIYQTADYGIALEEYDGSNLVKLKSNIPFEGGAVAIQLYKNISPAYVFVIEKQPPNLYYLNSVPSGIGDSKIYRVFAARADQDGKYCLVTKHMASRWKGGD